MKNMVNTKHDTTSYERCSYQREIYDIEVLYEAFMKAKVNSDWKSHVQKFEINLLTELSQLQKELMNKTFKFSKPIKFVLNERGKTRLISGDCIRDRVVKRAMCDEILIPSIEKYLIYDNGASLKGKGISFTRERLNIHLRKYYNSNKSNEGYILLGDYSKFFDNIQHELLMNMFKKIIKDDLTIALLEQILEQSRIDISHMGDISIFDALNSVFNSLEHVNIKSSYNKRLIGKSMNIGDQVAQIAGIFYPHMFDNYIKIVEGVKYYGRYMDDFYIIHNDKEYLKYLIERLNTEASKNGLVLHPNKTRICKISDKWRYLQIQYSLTKNGRIIQKIHPKRITSMRRKLKKLVYLLEPVEFSNFYKSWINNHYTIMSRQQLYNMNKLYKTLKEDNYV